MPAARHISRSPSIAFAVMATIRSGAVGPSGADAPRRLEPVHLRHLHVHQHEVVRLPLQVVEDLEAVARDGGGVAHPLEQPRRELHVHGVVLGEQDPERVRLGQARHRTPRSGVGRGALPATSGASTFSTASSSADGLTGLVSSAATASDRRSRVPTEDRMSTGAGSRPPLARHRASPRPARRRPAPACACRGSRGRTPRRPAPSRGPRAATRCPRSSSPSGRRAPGRCAGWCRCRRRRGRGSRAGRAPARAVAGTRSGASSARTTRWNVAPSPATPLLSASSEPSISSASRRLIARPRPVPPYRRLIDASTWLNDWNSRSIR